jgi:hypothetical protein
MEIVSIILRLKTQEIKVTAEEAKELFGQLTAVFGGEQIVHKEYVPYPVPTPVYPWREAQPLIIYDTGVRTTTQWSGTAYNTVAEGSGNTISSTDYKLEGYSNTETGPWINKGRKSFNGSSVTVNN